MYTLTKESALHHHAVVIDAREHANMSETTSLKDIGQILIRGGHRCHR